MKNKDIMASLPLLASVLGDKYGVEVRFGGDSACTDGNIIQLPNLPVDCDALFLGQVRGFLDHEAAHIRYTDFEALEAAKLNPIQQYLWNVLEDWRVENALARLFPGCRGNFNRLIEEQFNKSEGAGENPALSLLNYVLFSVRAWDVQSVERSREREAEIIEQHFPDLLIMIDAILEAAKRTCKSTQDCINSALDLYEAIEVYMEGSSLSSETAKDSLQKLLQAQEDDLPKGLGESLALNIQEKQAKNGELSYSVAIEGHKRTSVFNAHELEEIQRSSRALRTRLYGLLQASLRRPCLPGRRGKLNAKALHKLASHDPRVFLKLGEKREVSTAVHILLDCSGSMDGAKMELASKACFGLASSLWKIRGLNVGVTAFPALLDDNEQNEVAVFPLLKHGQRMHSQFKVKARGCTPLSEALWWIMQNMLGLREERKIVLVITDGMPDCSRSVFHALKCAQSLGFEVLGLGIEDSSLEMFLPKTSRTINELGALPQAMFEMLQQSLLQDK